MRARHLLAAFVMSSFTVMAQPPMGGPPQEAFSACSTKLEGTSCSFSDPHGLVNGSCRKMRGPLVCVPTGGPAGRVDARQNEKRGAPDRPSGRVLFVLQSQWQEL